MKTELVDVNETRRHLTVEIPTTDVESAIDRVTREYTKSARLPGFRPGKVPTSVVRQRFRAQILHDVAHDLIPRTIDSVLSERGVEPVDTPDVKDVVVEEGKPLSFTASFDVVPPFDPGDFSEIQLRRSAVTVDDDAVQATLERLRDRAARFEPVEGGVAEGHTLVIDLQRQTTGSDGVVGEADRHEKVSIEIGAPANPPGFDDKVMGMTVGETRSFTLDYPADYAVAELAGTSVAYAVDLKELRRRVVPALDDEFAKDLGEDLGLAGGAARPGAHRPRGRVARRLRAPAPRRPAEAAGQAPALPGAGGAGRPRGRPPGRGIRAPADVAADRPAARQHRLGGLPPGPA